MTKLTTILLPALALLAPLLSVSAHVLPEDSLPADPIPSIPSLLPTNLTIPTTATGAPNTLLPRYQATCKCQANGKCKQTWREYACRNSNCKGKEGARCNLARNEKGVFVAKCPNNELGFEWDWPWVGDKA